MTISSRSHFFGFSNYGVVQGIRFACGISIAPEGMFKGYSVVIMGFDPADTWQNAYHNDQLRLIGKAILHPQVSKAGRAYVLQHLLTWLDTPDGQNLGGAMAIYTNFLFLKQEGFILEWVFHPEIQEILDREFEAAKASEASEASKVA